LFVEKEVASSIDCSKFIAQKEFGEARLLASTVIFQASKYEYFNFRDIFKKC